MHIVFRVDSSDIIGTGHLMRCLTLAEALRKKGANCIFICRNHPKNIYFLIKDKGFSLHLLETLSDINQPLDNWLGVGQLEDAQQTVEVIKNLTAIPDWLIIDHYGIDITWEQQLKEYVKKIMVIDDLANRSHYCDVLLDQSYTHRWNRYEGLVPDDCCVLLGPEYAILRPEFLKARQQIEKRGRPPFDPSKVFIFFGGVDQENYTGKALDILPKIGNFAPEVVIGIQNPHRERIQQQMQNFPTGELHIQIDNMAEIMMRCSWYLGAGGSVTWERMCLGLTGIVVAIANNQIPVSTALASDNFHILINSIQDISKDRLHDFFVQIPELQIWNMNLVSTYGLDKICLRVFGEINLEKLTIRNVTIQDIFTLFLWANDPKVRNNSFNANPISLVEHRQWFLQRLKGSSTKFYILEYGHLPVGQIRFDLDQSIWFIDYSISSFLRGYGVGQVLLQKGEEALQKATRNSIKIQAKVKKTNLASLTCLKRNGYVEIERDSTLDYIVLQK
jgi:UDP-2,4-diacetamido-2,4,6-trideoxy-beta-L-altropyranose hydrolase